MKALKVASLVVVVVFVVALGIGAFALLKSQRVIQSAYDRAQSNAKEQSQRFLPQYLDDQLWVAKRFPFLTFETHTSDAGAFLNSRIGWYGGSNETKATELFLSDEIQESLMPPFDFAAFTLKTDIPNAKWMDSLAEYDHWEIFLSGANEKSLENLDFSPFSYQSPNFTLLHKWATIRLIQGLREKNITEAISANRHLAKLLISTETFIGTMVGVAVLGNESWLLEWIEKNQTKIDPTQIEPSLTNIDDIYRLKRLFFANPVATLGLSEDGIKLIQNAKAPLLGICAGLNEAGLANNYFRYLLEGVLKTGLLEFEQILNNSAQLPGTRHCRLHALKKLWNNEPYLSKIYSSNSSMDALKMTRFFEMSSSEGEEVKSSIDRKQAPGFPNRKILIRYSYLRDHFARLLMTLGNPNHWKLYEKRAGEANDGK